MKTYRMAVKVQDTNGRTHTEYTRHLTEAQLPGAREAARQGATFGSIRTIRVVEEK